MSRGERDDDERRSVVLVTLDSMRADSWGHLSGGDLTPAMDALAEDGLAFERAIAPGPSTPESMPAILTGSYPTDDEREYPSLLAARRARLRRHMHARETLAERFARRGYATAGFSPNPYTSRYFGFDAGFDHYEDFVSGSRDRLYAGALEGALAGTSLSALFPARVLLNWVQREEVFKPWEAFYSDVTGWLDGATEPYFLWVLLMDTHDPYLVPSDYRSQPRLATYHANWRLWRQGHEPPLSERTHERLRRAYDDTVRYADAFLDRLLGDLPGDPAIAVHADHGEAFGEHGTYGHQQRLYEENVHVPFAVAGGGVDPRTVERPVSLLDLPDLLTALSRGDAPDAALSRTPVRARTLAGDRVAFRGRDWKYRRAPDEEALYDLADDPGEREDWSAAAPDLLSACRDLARAWDSDRRERQRVADAAAEVPE